MSMNDITVYLKTLDISQDRLFSYMPLNFNFCYILKNQSLF